MPERERLWRDSTVRIGRQCDESRSPNLVALSQFGFFLKSHFEIYYLWILSHTQCSKNRGKIDTSSIGQCNKIHNYTVVRRTPLYSQSIGVELLIKIPSVASTGGTLFVVICQFNINYL
jgi:hypothetical protein